MSMDHPDAALQPLRQLFRFLSAFAGSNQPLPRRLDQQPLAQTARFWDELPIGGDYVQLSAPGDDSDWLLRVTLPPQHPCPPPPASLRDWLDNRWPDWRQAALEPLAELSRKPLLGDTRIDYFTDDPARVEAWQVWTALRDQWREIQQRHQPARELFGHLQLIHAELQKQGGDLELVLGCGLLEDGQSYRHPLLMRPVQLRFEGSHNRFTVEDGEHDTELYLPLLAEVSEHAGLVAALWREQVAALHPLDEAARVHCQVMHDWLANQPDAEAGAIHYRPVLFVRSRGGWAAQVADAIVGQLDRRSPAEVPQYLRRLAGLPSGEGFGAAQVPVSGEDILFALPANPEQFQLARQLEEHDIVLVQGPPGTGKTHTIANLIGHLLARRQRILITSHSSKALRVLRDKVPETIRSLCVSVLDDERRSRLELSQAIAALSENMARATRLQQTADGLLAQRRQLLDAERELRRQQRLCLQLEYEPVVIAGATTPPSEAARQVRAGRGTHDWLPPLTDTERGRACPLSAAEVHWLYASQELIPPRAEQELNAGLPDLAELPTPDAWRLTLTTLARHHQDAGRRQHWLWPRLDSAAISRLATALEDAELLLRELDQLTRHGPWLEQLVEAGLEPEEHDSAWPELFELIELSHQHQLRHHNLLLDHDPKLPPELAADPATLATLEAIHAWLQAGGGFSWWKLLVNPAWKKVLEQACCNGLTPTATVHVEALIAHAGGTQLQQRLLRRWERQVRVLGGIDLNPAWPARTAHEWLPQLRQAFGWGPSRWRDFVVRHVEPLGLPLDTLTQRIAPIGQSATPRLARLRRLLAEELLPEWRAHLARFSAEQVSATIDYSQQRLQPWLSQRAPDSAVVALLQAIQRQDAEGYRLAHERLQALTALRPDFQQRQALLDRLAHGAQQWAQAIRLRQPPHDVSLAADTDIAAAWQWRQFHDELHYRQQLDPARIGYSLAQAGADLHRVTGELISQLAWAHQAQAAEPYRQHLVGWQQTQTKIGKGTGKQATRLRQEAQQQLKLAQYAVPVWIMPLAEVFRSFGVDSQFDVVIVDEASQVDISGLLATFLGKKVVIVGDDEQVSPDAVGFDLDGARRLQQQYLELVPNAHLYDGQTSLYDLSKQVARGQLCLLEHFRCVPAIIGFSNRLSYQGRIKALREPASSPLRAHVVPYRVAGERQGLAKTNVQEADAIVRLIRAMCADPLYADKTLGVISLLGFEQATLIEQRLRATLSMQELADRRLLCGTSAQFQGDERDVILLSMVDSNVGDGPMRLQAEGARDMYKKRYNVAASRARDQLWIVHSVDYQNDLKPGDLRRQLLEYAHEQAVNRDADGEHVTESPFEAAVLNRLLERGYAVRTQYPVGYYRIDLVVLGAHGRLAVECDGDRYHSGSEKIEEDLARQAILERLGWTFFRLRGSAFFRDPEQALEGLWQRLDELDIRPRPTGSETPAPEAELPHQAIIRAAERLAKTGNEETIGEGTSVLPASESAPDHTSLTERLRQRSEERKKGLL